MLGRWLALAQQNPPLYNTFRLIEVTEHVCPDDPIKEFLGQELLGSYRNLEFLKFQFQNESKDKLTKYIRQYIVPSKRNQITKNVGQGDFGEVLASMIVSYFLGLVVPIRKLRLKFNKDSSLFCTDMIAHNTGERITDIHYYEVKTRLRIRKETVGKSCNHVTVNAHNSLLRDEQAPTEGIADFLSRSCYETSDFEGAQKYGDIVKHPEKYKRSFELFFVIEKKKHIRDILDDLDALPPVLKPLRVTVVLIENLGRLILDAQRLAIDAAVSCVYATP